MSASSKIEWTDATWNPVRGCDPVSPGCANCYAATMAARFSAPGLWGKGYAEMVGGKGRWTGKVDFLSERLSIPIGWRKPRRVFVCSTSDLFHESVSFESIASVFGVMAVCTQHTFQVLTKRPARMIEFFEWLRGEQRFIEFESTWNASGIDHPTVTIWPLPNVHLGVSVENQEMADERIPILLRCPASVRWVSAEPLLGQVDLSPYLGTIPEWSGQGTTLTGSLGDALRSLPDELSVPGIDWVVIGGESGPAARPCDVDWIRLIRDQCKAAGVACFVKQLGAAYVDAINGIGGAGVTQPDCIPPIRRLRDRKGGDIDEFPHDLRIREYPGDAS